MELSVSSQPSDIKSDGDSDRELVPDLESIKGSQGSDRVPLVGPGRGPMDPIRDPQNKSKPKIPRQWILMIFYLTPLRNPLRNPLRPVKGQL